MNRRLRRAAEQAEAAARRREARKGRRAAAPRGYLAALLKIAEERAEPGRVLVIDVAHDEWCPRLRGRGPCRCRPDVAVREGAS